MIKLQILLFSLIVPDEFNFGIGDLELSFYRLTLIALSPYVILSLFTKGIRWHISDAFALCVCVWPSIALLINTGFSQAIESGGVLFLESFVPYFLARVSITNYEQLKEISIILFKVISIVVFLGLLDTVTGQYITHKIAHAITGSSIELQTEQRFGFLRAAGPTAHPIIYGSLCASGFAIAIAFFQRRPNHISTVAITLLGVLTSLSSAPLLSIVAQGGLLIWSKLFRGNAKKWVLLFLTVAFSYTVIDILSNRDPFRVMFSYLLFNEHNGYVRYNMWINSISLANQNLFNGFFGYGFSKDMFDLIDSLFFSTLMKRSVDSYWLVILLRYGWVMLLLNVIFIFLIFKQNINLGRQNKSSRQRRLNEAWLISIISFSLLACTVHLTGSIISFYMFILGCSMIQPNTKSKNTKEDIRMSLRKLTR